jgi:hypothetical protein
MVVFSDHYRGAYAPKRSCVIRGQTTNEPQVSILEILPHRLFYGLGVCPLDCLSNRPVLIDASMAHPSA